MIAYKNGQTSIVLRFKLLDSTSSSGAGLTGLTSASSGLRISTIADNEATATAYTVAGSTIESITTLGTYAAPTATKCRFKEVDATNHPGLYEFQFADARFAVSSAKSLIVSVSGATNQAQADFIVPLVSDDPYVAKPSNYSSLSIDASGRVDVIKINGTSQTARDIGASVLLSAGTGTGQLDFTSGVVKANVTQNAGTNITAAAGVQEVKVASIAAAAITATSIAADAITDAKVASDVTIASVTGAVGSVTGDVGGNVTGSVGSVTGLTASDVGAIKTKTDSLTFTVAGMVDSNVIDWKSATAPAMTGDAYARIGAAGAGLTALGDTRIAHLDADISSRMATFTLPTNFSSMAISVGGAVTFGNTSIATVTNLTNAPTSGDFTTAMKASLNAATPAVTVSDKTGFSLASDGLAAVTAWTVAITGNITGSLSGSVGSVTGNVGGNLTGTIGGLSTQAKADVNAEADTALADAGVTTTVTGRIDAAISSRLAAGSYTAPDNTSITAIKAKTDNLPASPAATGDAMTLTSAYDAAKTAASASAVSAVAVNVATIKGSTDNLPSDPADQSLIIAATDAIMTRIGAPAGASVSADVAAVKSDSGAIKAKTDSLAFTVSGQVDANIQYVNDTQVTGNGAGTPWGP